MQRIKCQHKEKNTVGNMVIYWTLFISNDLSPPSSNSAVLEFIQSFSAFHIPLGR